MTWTPDITIVIANTEEYGTTTYEFLVTHGSWDDKEKMEKAIEVLKMLYARYW